MTRSQTTQGDRTAAVLDWFKRNHTWILLGLFVTALVLQYVAKVIKSDGVTVGTGLALLASVLERLVKIGGDTHEILDLQRAGALPVYSLAGAMEDLHDRLEQTPNPPRAVIKHLGLNMTSAWELLAQTLSSCDARIVECQLLIMTDKPTELGPDAAPEMRDWCEQVPAAITMIGKQVPLLAQDLQRRGRSLQFSLRKYKGTPRIHGVVLTQPFERGYVSFASWPGATFEWGGDVYFSFANGTASKADRRLRELLKGAFEYHWDAPVTEVLLVHPAPPMSPKPAGMPVAAGLPGLEPI